jgi:Tol biopolymer transport system component
MISIAWGADGRSIYFPKLRDPDKNIFDIYKVSVDGGNAEKIDLGLYWIRSLTASPDGRSITFSSLGEAPEPYQVWVMENFLPAAKEKK